MIAYIDINEVGLDSKIKLHVTAVQDNELSIYIYIYMYVNYIVISVVIDTI